MTQHSDFPVLALSEIINISNAETVLSQLNGFVEPSLNVDLSAVTHCDSAGLAALIEGKRLAKAQQREITYHDAPKQLLDLAKFLKIDDWLFAKIDLS